MRYSSLICRLLPIFPAAVAFAQPADAPPARADRDQRAVVVGDREASTAPPVNEIDLRRALAVTTAPAHRAVAAVIVGGEQASLGAIVSPDGYIITTVENVAGPISVRLPGGRSAPARVVGTSLEHGLALLKVDATDLPTLQFDTGPDAPVGKWIASVGMSEVPLAVSVVSVARRLIPADAIMGVFLEDSDAEGGEIPGALVARLDPQGGAARAGVRIGDIIIKIDGQSVVERQDVLTSLSRMQPGQKVAVLVVRGDERLTLNVPLSKRPAPSTRSLRQNTMGGKLSTRRTGFAAVLQHDGVTLQPKDCGSPLVTLDGKVVGLNVSRAGRTETYAVPSSVVAKVIDELKQSEQDSHDAAVSSDDKPDPESGSERRATEAPTTQPGR